MGPSWWECSKSTSIYSRRKARKRFARSAALGAGSVPRSEVPRHPQHGGRRDFLPRRSFPKFGFSTFMPAAERSMMRAAVQGAGREHGVQCSRSKLLGITILTSLDDAELLRARGLKATPGATALGLARLAKKSGLDGVVASPKEVKRIRRPAGPILIVVPGIGRRKPERVKPMTRRGSRPPRRRFERLATISSSGGPLQQRPIRRQRHRPSRRKLRQRCSFRLEFDPSPTLL